MVNEATTRANEATRSSAEQGSGAHQHVLEGYLERFAESAGGGWWQAQRDIQRCQRRTSDLELAVLLGEGKETPVNFICRPK